MTETVAAESSRARGVIFGLSAVVVLAVGVVLAASSGRATPGQAPSLLAQINVSLNASAFGCLLAGYASIRARRPRLHRNFMLIAFGLSSAFLVTYLLHHAQVGSVPFVGQGLIRAVYFSVLIPHVVLAAIIVPLALFTLTRGWTGRLEAHVKIARWTLPLWLYVSGSGVLVYFLLYHVGP